MTGTGTWDAAYKVRHMGDPMAVLDLPCRTNCIPCVHLIPGLYYTRGLFMSYMLCPMIGVLLCNFPLLWLSSSLLYHPTVSTISSVTVDGEIIMTEETV